MQQDAYAIADLGASYRLGRWTAILFADNVTNEAYLAGRAFDNFAFGRDGVRYAPLEAPRVVGVQLEARW